MWLRLYNIVLKPLKCSYLRILGIVCQPRFTKFWFTVFWYLNGLHFPLVVAQEARNKDINKYRECFTRKHSKTSTMQNVFNRFLLTSDPYTYVYWALARNTRKKQKNYHQKLCNWQFSEKEWFKSFDSSDESNKYILYKDNFFFKEVLNLYHLNCCASVLIGFT